MAKMTPEQRSRHARAAVMTRWAKKAAWRPQGRHAHQISSG
jgi:hypothetical protein